jgi:membrane-bound lytic murein transglycosylase B
MLSLMKHFAFRQAGSARKSRLALLLGAAILTAATPARADFQGWVGSFRAVALENGIKGSIYDKAFANVTSPDPVVLEKARFQPEFKDSNWNYFDNRVNDGSILEGRAKGEEFGSTLAAVRPRFCWPSGRWKPTMAASWTIWM